MLQSQYWGLAARLFRGCPKFCQNLQGIVRRSQHKTAPLQTNGTSSTAKAKRFPSSKELLGKESKETHYVLFELQPQNARWPYMFALVSCTQLLIWPYCFWKAWSRRRDRKKKSTEEEEMIMKKRAQRVQQRDNVYVPKRSKQQEPDFSDLSETAWFFSRFSYKYDFTIISVASLLGGILFTGGAVLSLRYVTKWSYDFATRTHFIQTLTPIGIKRTLKIPHGKIARKQKHTWGNNYVLKAEEHRLNFLVDRRRGFVPNLRQLNLVI